MKVVTISYEFPDNYDHDEFVDIVNGALTDSDYELAEQITYTIKERKTI